MSKVRQLHDKAMELNQLAIVERDVGKWRKAKKLCAEALILERKAARMIPFNKDSEPTRSILYRSAATLAYQSNSPEAVRELAEEGCSEFTPSDLKREFRDLKNSARALERIQEIQARNDTTLLDLTNCGLVELPPGIWQLTKLRVLLLGQNNLVALPAHIQLLSELEILDLSHNHLAYLPEQIGQLKQIKSLNMTNNELYEVPLELANCPDLNFLFLGSNNITSLPDSIGNLKALHIEANPIAELPPSINHLVNLRDLRLDQNQIASLQDSSLQHFLSLESLTLSINQAEQKDDKDISGSKDEPTWRKAYSVSHSSIDKQFHAMFDETATFVEFLEAKLSDIDDIKINVTRRLEHTNLQDLAAEMLLSLSNLRYPEEQKIKNLATLEKHIQNSTVSSLIENAFYFHFTIDVTSQAISLSQKAAPRLHHMLTQLQQLDSEIQEVKENWEEIPLDKFGNEAIRQHWEDAVIRLGLFRQLVLARAKERSVTRFLFSAVSQPEVRLLPNYLPVLQQWLRPFPESSKTQAQVRSDELEEAIEESNIESLTRLAERFIEEHLVHGETKVAAETLCGLANYAAERGALDLQLILTKKSCDLEPGDGWVLAQYANALLYCGRDEEAATYYSQAEQAKQPFDGDLDRAETLSHLNRLEESLDFYSTATTKNPNSADAKIGRAKSLFRLGRLQESLAAYTDAVTNHKGSGEARTGRAEVLRELGRPDEAQLELRTLSGMHKDELFGLHELRKDQVRQGEHRMRPITVLASERDLASAFHRNLNSVDDDDLDSTFTDLAISKYLSTKRDDQED